MHLYLTARHLELSDGLRAHVDRHVVEPATRHAGTRRINRMEVQLYKESEREVRFGCHILLGLEGGQDINIREDAGDLYEAIDRAQKRLLRNLTDERDRVLTENRHPKKYSFARLGRALGWARKGA